MTTKTLTPDQTPRPGMMGPHTSMAVQRLKTGKIGDVIPLAEMNEIVGRDCSHNGTGGGNVRTATRHVEAVFGIVWEWSKSAKAWLCLNDPQRLDKSHRGIKSAGRKANRAMQTAATIDRAKLPEGDQRDLDITLTNSAMIGMVASGAFQRAAQAALTNGADRLHRPETAKLLELMRGEPAKPQPSTPSPSPSPLNPEP